MSTQTFSSPPPPTLSWESAAGLQSGPGGHVRTCSTPKAGTGTRSRERCGSAVGALAFALARTLVCEVWNTFRAPVPIYSCMHGFSTSRKDDTKRKKTDVPELMSKMREDNQGPMRWAKFWNTKRSHVLSTTTEWRSDKYQQISVTQNAPNMLLCMYVCTFEREWRPDTSDFLQTNHACSPKKNGETLTVTIRPSIAATALVANEQELTEAAELGAMRSPPAGRGGSDFEGCTAM